MSRIPRFLKSDTVTIYHVISRTALDGCPISDVGKDVLLGLIKKFSTFYVVDVLGFALMGNHIHLAVRMHSASDVSDEDIRKRMEAWYADGRFITPNAILRHKTMLTSLSHYMKSIKQAFTRYYNKTHNRRGFFWGDRFKSVIVEDGPTLINLLAYIDLNPVRAGLVTRPEDYRWNTLGYHTGTGNPDGFLATDFGMKEWNEYDPEEIMGAYREFVYDGILAGSDPTAISFGSGVSDIESLHEALASYVIRAGEKLRRKNLTAGSVHVFLSTNRFRPGPQYAKSACLTLMPATSYTPAIQTKARCILEKIFRPGYTFQKVGVMLTNLANPSSRQRSFFDPSPQKKSRHQSLMSVMDSINNQYGSATVTLASAGQGQKKWHMRRKFLSKRYTTSWAELAEVR